MKLTSRTTHLAYEPIDGMPRPKDLPPLGDTTSYLEEYAAQTGLSRSWARRLFRAAGIDQRIDKLRREPQYLEEVLRDVGARPLVASALTFNATTVLRDEDRRGEPLDRAARLIAAARSFYGELLAGQLSLDTLKGEPLEMGQYRNLFSTCMYPRGACFDVYKSSRDSYIVVIVNRQYFKIDLPLVAGQVDCPALESALQAAVRAAQAIPTPNSPGVLSATGPLPRMVGLTAMRLRADNRASFEVLANAFLVLSLDLETMPQDEEEACRIAQSGNLDNRWHLASTQIVVYGNSQAAVVYSYTCGIDGNVMTRFSSELRQRALQLPVSRVEPGCPAGLPLAPLQWKMLAWVRRWAESACRKVLTPERALYRLYNWGGQNLRQRGLRLDAIFNLALLMTAHRLAERPVLYYELLTMSKYRNRGLSNAVLTSAAMAQLLNRVSEHADGPVAADALQQALAAHTQALRDGRNRLCLLEILSLQLALAPFWRKPVALLLLVKLLMTIDIVVSSPHATDDVVITGRIGVRLLTRLFALHYEIHDDEISLAFMQASSPHFSNATVVTAFEECLRQIVRMAECDLEVKTQPAPLNVPIIATR